MDGRPWRTIPEDVVLRCGLAAGVELDRPLLRVLAAELRRTEALGLAGRALARRDLSRRRLAERLDRAGVPAAAGAAALSALSEAGALADARVAERRAASLAERGWGDLAIAARLESEGLEEPDVRAAIATLAPETERASRAVAGIRDVRRAWTLLSRRGFPPETIEAVLGALDDDESGGLG